VPVVSHFLGGWVDQIACLIQTGRTVLRQKATPAWHDHTVVLVQKVKEVAVDRHWVRKILWGAELDRQVELEWIDQLMTPKCNEPKFSTSAPISQYPSTFNPN